MSANVKASVENKTTKFCLNCKTSSEEEKYYEIFDEIGVELNLNELLLKYFQLKVVKKNSTNEQVICEQCLDKLTNALDEDEYQNEKKQAAKVQKSQKMAIKVLVPKAKTPSTDKDNKNEKNITNLPKAKIATPKKGKSGESANDDIEDMIQQVLESDHAFTVEESNSADVEESVFVLSSEGIHEVEKGNDFVEDSEILYDDILKFNTNDDTKISLKSQNAVGYVISDSVGDEDDSQSGIVINADETYEDFEHIEDFDSEEEFQDTIELYTLNPFSKDDDNHDHLVKVSSYLDEAIKSDLTTFRFAWLTECHICSWNCETFENLVAHVECKHKSANDLYACPAKDCNQQVEGMKMFARHLILMHGPLNKLSIYGSCPACGLTFSNFMVFNRHSCARMIKRRRGMRFRCKICEIDFSSMKRYVFHLQFHLEKHRPKICLVCNYKSNDIEELFEHVNYDHEQQDVYPCRICDRSFKKKQYLLEHKHLSNNQFICKECNRIYHFRTSLIAHMKYSHSPVLQCNLCDKEFSNESNYRYHQKSHMNTTMALHSCSNCGLVSADRNRILNHVNEEDTDCYGVEVEDEVVSVAYTCEFCSLDFKSKCDLKLHRSTGIHADGQFYCSTCKKYFSTMKSFKSHRKHIDAKLDRENIFYLYMCNVDECDESYTRWNSLYAHKRRHHTVDKSEDPDFADAADDEAEKKDKNFVCQFCDKLCPTKMSLSVHVARRHNNRNVICSECNASFKNEQALQKHVDFFHTPIECPLCLKTIKNRRNYQVHERVVHMGEKRYFCNVCNKGFYHNSEREAHAKLHEKTYACEKCDFTTNYAKSMETHIANIHRREFDYKCDLCDKKFSRKHALTTHLSKHCKVTRFVCEKTKDKSCQKVFTTRALLKRHLKYKHKDEDNNELMSKSDHEEEGQPQVKRSKRLQLKKTTDSQSINDDLFVVNDIDPIKLEQVASKDNETDVQDDAGIQYTDVDDELQQLVEFVEFEKKLGEQVAKEEEQIS